jgi:hypothetical protein
MLFVIAYCVIGLILGMVVPAPRTPGVDNSSDGLWMLGFVVLWPIILPYWLVTRIWS